MKLNVHLNFQGNCAAAFEFDHKVFGATNTFTMKYGRRLTACRCRRSGRTRLCIPRFRWETVC